MLELIKEKLLLLKMHQAINEFDSIAKRFQDKEEFLLALLDAEVKKRQIDTVIRKIAAAKFPFEREWAQIDPKLNPKIPFNEIQKLSDGKFIQNKQNLCFIGDTGLGKTHSLIAIGRDLCRKGMSVRFYTACILTTLLEEAKAANQLSKFMDKLLKIKLIIVDELGFVPFSETGARLLFDVFAQRYETGSMAVSTNLEFTKWTQVFGSIELTKALIDRFTHRCDIRLFDGDSVRLMEAQGKIGKKSNFNVPKTMKQINDQAKV